MYAVNKKLQNKLLIFVKAYYLSSMLHACVIFSNFLQAIMCNHRHFLYWPFNVLLTAKMSSFY